MADWFAENAPKTAAPPPPAQGDWFARNAPAPASTPPAPQGYLSQVGSGLWNTVKGLAQVGVETGGTVFDPINAVEHLKNLKRMVLDPQVDQAIKAADEWKKGNRSESVGHALAAVLPGVGPAAANIGEKLGNQDYTGAAADATVLGATMVAPKVAGAIVDAAPVLKGAAEGGYAAATETIPLSRHGVAINVPKPLASGAAAGAAARMAGLPATPAAIIGGAAPIVRGMVRGARRVLNGPAPESFTEAPIQAAGIIGERTAPPMPESFTQTPIQASEIIGERTAPAASPAVVETPGMALARASGQDWAKLSAADRGMLETVARANANAAAQPAARPPMGPPQAAPREPIITPPPDIPPESAPPAAVVAVDSSLDQLAQHWAGVDFASLSPQQQAQLHTINYRVNGVPPPPESGPPAAPAPEPAPPSPPAGGKPAAADLAAQLEASMRTEALTDYAIRNKIPAAMLDEFGPKEWQMVADQAGVKPPTPENIQAIRGNLAEHEGASQITAKTPAEAAAEFETKRATRNKRNPKPAPEPPPDVEAQLADSLAAVEKGERPVAQVPEEGPPAATASDKRVEAYAQHFATSGTPIADIEPLTKLPEFPKLGRALEIQGSLGPGEAQRIAARVQELRGGDEGPAAPVAAVPPAPQGPQPAATPTELPADIGKLSPADAEARFRDIVTQLRSTMGGDAEKVIRGELPSRYPGWSGEIPTSDVQVDPVRFQFKRDVGQGGAGAKLKNVSVWDPNKGGTILVWKDPANGQTYVINGHHRIELAQRLNVPDVNVRYLHAADAADARLQGALVNISEDSGNVMDAAKVFRESGLTPEQLKAEGVAIEGRIARPGMAVANLSPTLFQAVLSGDLPEARGAVIGQLQSHADQHAVFSMIRQAEKRGSTLTDGQVRELIRMNERAPTVTESSADSGQGGLFGDVETTRSLLPEKARVSDYVRDQLRSEKRLFGAVSSQAAAERLESTGNVIQAAENMQVAQRANQGSALYDKLSTVSGPIDKALNDAAQAIGNGETVSEVNKRTYRTIRDELERQLQSLTRESKSGDSGTAGHSAQGTLEGGTGQPGDTSSGGGHPQPATETVGPQTLRHLMQPEPPAAAAPRARRSKPVR